MLLLLLGWLSLFSGYQQQKVLSRIEERRHGNSKGQQAGVSGNSSSKRRGVVRGTPGKGPKEEEQQQQKEEMLQEEQE
ncbi:GL12669 [Drosophila persimilis]|uniref:GL12669 n=1 Tax=Drosophila persimilis TaxID=7234 RepID=B4GLY6_DROPE|nr:GL12669 [Drosophila persimilis]